MFDKCEVINDTKGVKHIKCNLENLLDNTYDNDILEFISNLSTMGFKNVGINEFVFEQENSLIDRILYTNINYVHSKLTIKKINKDIIFYTLLNLISFFSYGLIREFPFPSIFHNYYITYHTEITINENVVRINGKLSSNDMTIFEYTISMTLKKVNKVLRVQTINEFIFKSDKKIIQRFTKWNKFKEWIEYIPESTQIGLTPFSGESLNTLRELNRLIVSVIENTNSSIKINVDQESNLLLIKTSDTEIEIKGNKLRVMDPNILKRLNKIVFR